jgi:hypothetical protein
MRFDRAICADGVWRKVRLSPNGADTFFSIPGSVQAHGKTISGYVTRETMGGYDTATPEDPAVTKFVAYRYGKNFNVLGEGKWRT